VGLTALCAVGGLTLVSPPAWADTAFVARGSVTGPAQYVGDSVGTTFRVAVDNTNAAMSVGAVAVSAPSGWRIVSCPAGPAGWSRTAVAGQCRFTSPPGGVGDLRPHTVSSSFRVKATTRSSATDLVGRWTVRAYRESGFIGTPAVASPGGSSMVTHAYSLEVRRVVVGTAPASGTACPPVATTAPAGSLRTLVVCAVNRSTSALTPVFDHSRLSGTFAAGGSYLSSHAEAGPATSFLSSWRDTTILAAGASKTVAVRLGTTTGQSSPTTTFGGFVSEAASTPAPTASPTPTASPSPTETPSATPTPTPTATSTATPTLSPSPSPSPTTAPVDQAPTAVSDAASANEDVGTAVDVLANDTDVDGGPKAVGSVTQPANGAVVITGGGTGLTYAPNANYCNNPPGTAPDTFTYTLNGGSTATVSVSVTCVDDPAVAVNDAGTVAENASGGTVNALANDTDVDGGALSIVAVTQPANGAVVVTGGGAGLVYTPSTNYCNSPPGTSPDTFTYSVTGGSTASVSMTVVCDTTGPTITFDSTPPASWPVNYFDVSWHANESATYQCSLNGAAFTTCTSPTSITTTYNTLSTFAVRGTDALSNLGPTSTTSWTSTTGLVLHYAWEQGALDNTSLLAQRPLHSPGAAGGPLTAVGGWAGTALRNPSQHTYTGTVRPLVSSPNGQYMAGMWVRPYDANATGTLWSNVHANGLYGHEVLISGTTITLRVLQNGVAYTTTGTVPTLTWAHVGVRTQGPTKGLELLINGSVVGVTAPPSATGFDAGQGDVRVGTVTLVDVDDLRFYNTLIDPCVFVRGVVNGQGACVAGRPAIELDFEGGRIDQTGFMSLAVQAPAWSPYVGATGDGLRLSTTPGPFSLSGFAQQAATPGHTISLWTVGDSPADTLFDVTKQCAVGLPATCGIKISWTSNRQFAVQASTASGGVTTWTSAFLDTTSHSLVVAEQRSGSTTTSLRFYVDGALSDTLGLSGGDVFGVVNDTIQLPTQAGTAVDEIELWPLDLSASPDMLCENGFDGRYDPATDGCTLTSN
jgi:hypothetical protein